MEFLNEFASWLWGIPLLALLMGGGLLLSIRTGFFQIRYFPYILKETIGKVFDKDEKGKGTVSPFQAMTTALASSIGAANIVVAPTIIFTAGPGAIFWMWIAAIIGQATKFSEVALSIKYREVNDEGDHVGGCSYMLKNGLKGKAGKILGGLAAFFFMLEIFPSIALQTLSAVGPVVNVANLFNLDEKTVRIVATIAIFIIVSVVVFGGVKQIGKVTEKLIPIMAIAYILFCLIIIFLNIGKLGDVLNYIFVGAFNPRAVVGGVAGHSLKKVLSAGVARGVYSNEAGMGSAGYGHAAATTDHPARQGFWGVFEVFADTIVICTLSTLVVLMTGVWSPEMSSKEMLATAPVAVERAFNQTFGSFGSILISVSLFLFVLSTIIVIVFYCQKQAEYLFNTSVGNIVRIIASLMMLVSIFISFDKAGVFLDITLGLVVIPNMIGLIKMSGEVRDIKKDFFENPKFYKKAKTK